MTEVETLKAEIAALRAEIQKKDKRLKQWEDEDVHEAMACYISNKQMDEMKTKVHGLERSLRRAVHTIRYWSDFDPPDGRRANVMNLIADEIERNLK